MIGISVTQNLRCAGNMLAVAGFMAAACFARQELCGTPGAHATASYIVEASSTAGAQAAVMGVGGRVTHDLEIIDAVAAELTPAQRARLASWRGVRQVFDDAPVTLASTDPSYSTVRDNFDQVSWSNSDGDHRWATDWVEKGDDGTPSRGRSFISSSPHGGGQLVLQGSGSSLARRASLAPGAVHAMLSMDVQRVSLAASARVSIQASKDGGFQWTEVGSIAGPANDSTALQIHFDVSEFISSDTAVRLVAAMSTTSTRPATVYVDNLELRYDSVYASGVSYPSLAGADRLQAGGVTGQQVTVAVLDTGYWSHPALNATAQGERRVLAQYDTTGIKDFLYLNLSRGINVFGPVSTDLAGHGTHVTGIMMNTGHTGDGRWFGIAPNAKLVSVRAFGADGRGTYSSVIRGIDWIVRNRSNYGIRVLNLSLGATPRSYYWDDPLNRAVMKAWRAGIVVVASAGNTGPGAQSITVPGNVPYIVTVGAMTDSYTPADPADDRLTSFSAAGPTYEGFVKPDVVAPGGHVWSFMPTYASIAQAHPFYQNNGDYFTMSGTSQAAAVVSGVVALLLQADPSLTPDEVKCRLITSAHSAVNPDGGLAYSVFQQGAGLVNAYDAAHAARRDCANRGLDIDKDLAGTEHYGGGARLDSDGNYYLTDGSGYAWNQEYTWDQGYTWNQLRWASDDSAWSQGYVWQMNDADWQASEPWTPGNSPDTASPMSINTWVDQE